MYASSVAFVKPYRLGLTARFQVALNVICEDTGSVDFLTRELMLMLLYLAARRLQDICLSRI